MVSTILPLPFLRIVKGGVERIVDLFLLLSFLVYDLWCVLALGSGGVIGTLLLIILEKSIGLAKRCAGRREKTVPMLLDFVTSDMLALPTTIEFISAAQRLPLIGQLAIRLCLFLKSPYSGLLFPSVIALNMTNTKIHVAGIIRPRPHLRNLFGGFHAAALTNFGEFVGGIAVLCIVEEMNLRDGRMCGRASPPRLYSPASSASLGISERFPILPTPSQKSSQPISALVTSVSTAFVKMAGTSLLTASTEVSLSDISAVLDGTSLASSRATEQSSFDSMTDDQRRKTDDAYSSEIATASTTPLPICSALIGKSEGFSAASEEPSTTPPTAVQPPCLNVYSQVSDAEGTIVCHVNVHWRIARGGHSHHLRPSRSVN